MKKYLILFVAVLFIVVSCSKSKVHVSPEASVELRSSTVVSESDLPTLFSYAYPNINFSEYWTETVKGELHYFGKGTDSNGNTTEARLTDDQKESCSGVGCSYCKIDAVNGGCKCERKATSTGYCNHTVSSFDLEDYFGNS